MSAKEVRRAEVLAQVKGNRMQLVEAAELLGVSYRQAKRLKRRYGEGGARALVHGNAGRRSHRAKPEAERQRALELVRQHYSGAQGERLGPTLAAEMLAKQHGVELDEETLRRWMLGAGLWSQERRRKQHRQRRERKAHFGELVQMDGSPHAWLGKRGPKACLLDLVDDATGRAAGRFEAEETTWAAADGLRHWVEQHGIPQALYTDWKNTYVRRATPAEELRGQAPLTQFGRMCARLGVRIIAAGSPQAKGRIERGHGTHQDRMVKKMRLLGIGDYEAANRYLEQTYWAEHNQRFAVAPRSSVDYHRPLPTGMKLDEVFSLETERVVSQDWVVSYQGRRLQIEAGQRVRPKQKVVVQEQRSGKLRLLAGGVELRWSETAVRPRPPQPERHMSVQEAAQIRVRRHVHRNLFQRKPAMEMPGYASGGSQTAASTARTALGNPTPSAGFPHSHG